MDSPDLKPKTKDELTHLMSLLNQAHSMDRARDLLPATIVSFIQKEIDTKHITYEEVIKNIKMYLKSLKDIKIYLPLDPSQSLLQAIIQFFSSHFSDRYIDIYVDPDLIAGVKVVIDGKLYDESLVTKIESHF